MAGEFQAGSVLVELKAQHADLVKNIRAAKVEVSNFGSGVQTASKQIEGGNQKIERSFNRANIQITRAIGRFAALQFAVGQISQGKDGLGALGQALDAVSKGAQAATIAFHAFQGKISAKGAGAIGVGVAGVTFYAERLKTAIEATDLATAASVRANLALSQLSDAFSDAAKSQAVFGATGLQVAQNKLQTMQAIFEANLKRLREIPEEIAAIEQKLSAAREGFFNADLVKNLELSLGGLRTEAANRSRTNADIARTAAGSKLDTTLKQIAEDAAKATKAFTDLQAIGERSIDLGIAEPAEVAEIRLRAAKTRLDELLKQELKLLQLLDDPKLSQEARTDVLNQISGLQRGIGSSRADILREQEFKEIEEQNKRIADEDIRRIEQNERLWNGVADNFSSALGAGIEAAIIGGEKPLAALAKTGEALFSNMLNESLRSFSAGLSSILQGTGLGEAGAAAVTGVLGIAGGIFANRQNKKNESFTGVRSIVESSQAVRGIVAGPSSVAIAEVGADLARANAPMVELLRLIVRYTSETATNTRGGRRQAGGGGAEAVFVPTA